MGSPKFQRKKYQTPQHPWRSANIEEEKKLLNEYGLKNKKEIWKSQSFLRSLKKQVKRLIALQTAQAEIERKQLIDKLVRLNLLKPKSTLDDVLGLSINDVLSRRLQNIVYKNKLARTVKQARQFVIHGHIKINDKGINVPSYLVSADEENKIAFDPNSALSATEHPERVIVKKEKAVKKKGKESKETKNG